MNFVAIILAMVGNLIPRVGRPLFTTAVALLVVANSALLLRWAYKSNHAVEDDDSVLVNAARKRVFEGLIVVHYKYRYGGCVHRFDY